MGVIEEDPLHIQSRPTSKSNGSDNEKSHDQEDEAKNKQTIKKSEIIISLTDLPSNVLVDILARLPLRTLFVARSVCKSFVFLTTDNPHFINLHSSKAAQILVFQLRLSSILRMADNELDYKNSQPKHPLFRLPKVGTTFLVNSCNGLLFFRRNMPDDYRSLVCNPVTSEYTTIPRVVFDPEMRLDMSLWLGFSPGTNQYKVLRIFSRMNGGAQVYVIGCESWRGIDDSLLLRRPFGSLGQTLVNGLMYWHYRFWPSLTFFDFDREKFGEFALPAGFQEEQFIKEHYTSIGVLGGCLCVSCNDFAARRVDLWLLRKCGNQESWTKEFVFDTVTLGHKGQPVIGRFKPLHFLGNGEILMQWMTKALVCLTREPRA